MSYKIKTQRQAAERRQQELELRLTKMCIDLGNFVLQSREKSGNGDGASGTTALAAGDVVPVINTNVGVRSITLTEAMATSIKNAAVAAASEFAGSTVAIADLEWNILTVDTTTAGLTTGGVADLIMLVSLDSTPVFKDRIPQVRTRLQVGLTTGFDFNLVGNTQYSAAYEGHGRIS